MEKRYAEKREGYYLRTYGMSRSAVEGLLTLQGGRCAICRELVQRESLHVDHDHGSGTVRGILCRACNQGIGLFRDNPDLVGGAIAYLRDSQPIARQAGT